MLSLQPRQHECFSLRYALIFDAATVWTIPDGFMDKLTRSILLIAGVIVAQTVYAQPAKHVILVTLDGFAAYHLYNQELRLPNIRELIDRGVWVASSETVFPSVTHPSHTTIVTGVEPRLHGVIGNSMVNRKTGESLIPQTSHGKRSCVCRRFSMLRNVQS